jgi:hypothetical protein
MLPSLPLTYGSDNIRLFCYLSAEFNSSCCREDNSKTVHRHLLATKRLSK